MDAKGVTLKYTYGDVGQASRLECIFERDVASSLDDTAGRLVKEGNKTYRYGYLDKVLSVIDGDTTRTFTYHADGQLASATVGGEHRAPRDRVGPHPCQGIRFADSLRLGDTTGRPLPESETFQWGASRLSRGWKPRLHGWSPLRRHEGAFAAAIEPTVYE